MLHGLAQRRRVSRVVTVIMKTFQRLRTATRAVEPRRRYHPEIRLLIADDTREELAFHHPAAEVIRLPFDSALCGGLDPRPEMDGAPDRGPRAGGG